MTELCYCLKKGCWGGLLLISVLGGITACHRTKPEPSQSEKKAVDTTSDYATENASANRQISPSPNGLAATRSPMMDITAKPLVLESGSAYMVDLSTEKCAVEIRVNGVPLITVAADRPRNLGEIVNPWLMPEDNTIVLLPDSAAADSAHPCIQFKLLAIPKGETQRDAQTMAALKWPDADDKGKSGVRVHFAMPTDYPCVFWRQLTPVTALSDTDVQALKLLSKTLYDAFQRKDAAGLAHLTQSRGIFVGECLGLPREKGSSMQKRFFEMIFTQPEFVPEPWNDTTFTATLLENGLVKLGRSDGIMLLQAKQIGAGSDFYAGKIDGKWQIVH